MQTVLPFSRMSEAAERMDPKVLAYLNEGQIETFESFETFSIIAFDWYDVHSARTADSQMLLYLDRKDLLLFCEDDAAEEKARSIVAELTKEGPMDNEQLLYQFFVRLLKGDMAHLDQLEADISDGESAVLSGTRPGDLDRIAAWRPGAAAAQAVLRAAGLHFRRAFRQRQSASGKGQCPADGDPGHPAGPVSQRGAQPAGDGGAAAGGVSVPAVHPAKRPLKIFTVVTVLVLPLSLLTGVVRDEFCGDAGAWLEVRLSGRDHRQRADRGGAHLVLQTKKMAVRAEKSLPAAGKCGTLNPQIS